MKSLDLAAQLRNLGLTERAAEIARHKLEMMTEARMREQLEELAGAQIRSDAFS